VISVEISYWETTSRQHNERTAMNETVYVIVGGLVAGVSAGGNDNLWFSGVGGVHGGPCSGEAA